MSQPGSSDLPPRRFTYVEIADDIAARIASGDYAPGDKIPSYAEMSGLYDVKRSTAQAAVRELHARQLIDNAGTRGNFVREIQRLTRHAHGRDLRTAAGSTSPFARDAAAAGARAGWEHQSDRITADARVATRLGIAEGDPVMRTRYRFLADDEPIQLSTSWEPLALTAGTPIEWPEGGATLGVVARFDSIDVRVDEFTEHIIARAALADETERLKLSRSGFVLVIERTYWSEGRAVETADIVFPGDRYELVYRVPVD